MRPGPLKPGQDAGQGPGEILDHVSLHRQAEALEPGRVAVGIEQQNRDLRAHPFDDLGQDRPAGKPLQAFVAAPHACRPPAGEQHARDIVGVAR